MQIYKIIPIEKTFKTKKHILLMKKKSDKIKNRYMIIIVAAFSLILLFIFLGAKIYLYLNLLLGNDLVVLLNIDKENIFLKNGEEEKINIKISSITNPFCTPLCSSKFTDLSKNIVIEKDNFNLKPPSFINKEFLILSNNKGIGQNLYRFDLECRNTMSYLCKTKEELISKSILITLDYDLNDEEKIIRNESGERLTSLIKNEQHISSEIGKINKAFDEINKTIIIDSIGNRIYNYIFEINEINNNISEIRKLWDDDIINLNESLNNIEPLLQNSISKFNELKEDFILEISAYNNFTENITSMKNEFEKYNNTKVNKKTFEDAQIFMEDFNNFIKSLEKRDYIFTKKLSLMTLYERFVSLSNGINKETLNLDYVLYTTINESKLRTISLDPPENKFTFILNNPVPMCCVLGKCERCCDEGCEDDREKFPVILVHGHSFNKKTSAEYSFDTFTNLQRKLEDDGYINAGSIYSISYDNVTMGVLGRTNNPLSFRVSYYFDVFSTEEGSVIVQTKTDNIDTYAIRLKGIIDNIKYKTNKDKVVIVAHSMGGLVIRRYIQIFGSENIEKVILIGTPNKGLKINILNGCYLFGTELECRDMNEESLFINKLNNMNQQEVPFYNIIGTGCDMNSENGDGVVVENSAYLKGAKNYYVNGTCDESSFNYFHNSIMDINAYPEVYDIINNSLKE